MSNSLRKFYCIPLGVEGGLNEANLSAYLVAPLGSTSFACLDVGTLWKGLAAAISNDCFPEINPPDNCGLTAEGYLLRKHICAYLVTHAYLDHVSGLAIASPEDNRKPILALRSVVNDLREHVFNWRTWPNFADEGTPPVLGKYRYVVLPEGQRVPIPATEMRVTAYSLAHGVVDGDSSAFLIEANGYYVLYMGDTGPDEIESSDKTFQLWQKIAPLIQQGKLCGIFIEASYPNSQPTKRLFSHLTPSWLTKALWQLAELTDPLSPGNALSGLSVIVTHIKPSLELGPTVREVVKQEIIAGNELGLNLIFAEQGKRFDL